MQGAQIWSLVRELRFCMPQVAAKKKKQVKIKQQQKKREEVPLENSEAASLCQNNKSKVI